jgi:Tfp pilus assembly protein FimT
MIVIGIIAIICAIAIPNMFGWRQKRQLEAAVNEVQVAIGLAKSTAIKHSAPVSILLNNPANGITVFVDNNGNGSIDSGDRVVRTINLSDGVTLTTLPALTFLNFDTRGFTSAVNITVAKTQDPRRPRIEVTVAGSSRINWG